MQIPNYSDYDLLELVQALNSVREDLYPDTFAKLELEFYTRGSESRVELEQGYFQLNRRKRPDHGAWLLKRIRACGEEISLAPKEKGKRKRFWSRFGRRKLPEA